MNIDCEIGIRGDTCQCSALSLGCRQAWGRYRCATVACRHSSALKAATFPLYLHGEACLPFTSLIFLLRPLTIYSLPPPLPPQGTLLSLIFSSFCLSVWLCLSCSFYCLSLCSIPFCPASATDLQSDIKLGTCIHVPTSIKGGSFIT